MSMFSRSWPAMWQPGKYPIPEDAEVRYACEDETCPAAPVADSAHNAENNPKLCPVHEERGVRKSMNRMVVRR